MKNQSYIVSGSETCRGIIARGYSQIFTSGRRIEHKQGLRILKRKSCLGCEICGDNYYYIMNEYDWWCSLKILDEPIEDGKLYRIYLQGYEDDAEICIEKLK